MVVFSEVVRERQPETEWKSDLMQTVGCIYPLLQAVPSLSLLYAAILVVGGSSPFRDVTILRNPHPLKIQAITARREPISHYTHKEIAAYREQSIILE